LVEAAPFAGAEEEATEVERSKPLFREGGGAEAEDASSSAFWWRREERSEVRVESLDSSWFGEERERERERERKRNRGRDHVRRGKSNRQLVRRCGGRWRESKTDLVLSRLELGFLLGPGLGFGDEQVGDLLRLVGYAFLLIREEDRWHLD
jgi:hypothetical protein